MFRLTPAARALVLARAYHHKISLRSFHRTVKLLKDDKREHLLKELGASLQKGAINEKTNKKDKDGKELQEEEGQELADKDPTSSENPNTEESLSGGVDEAQEAHSKELVRQRLNDLYHASVDMTDKQFFLQLALDGDKPFMSTIPVNLIERKRILEELPDTLDLFNPDDMSKVDDIYSKLSRLDSDREMHAVCLQPFYKVEPNDLMLLEQGWKGISEKLKLFRRKEYDRFNPHTIIFEHLYDRRYYPYNVPGFDRSIFGMLLGNAIDEKAFPREFIQDLPSFGNIITLKKRDARPGKQEMSDSDILLNPEKVIPLQDVVNAHNRGKPTIVNRLVHKKNKDLVVIKNCLSYQQLRLRDTDNQIKMAIRLIEQDVRTKQAELAEEIKRCLQADNIKVLSPTLPSSQPDIKTGFFRVVCVSRVFIPELPWEVYGVLNSRSFNMLPNYVVLSGRRFPRKLNRRLNNHIYKVFLINLEAQIEQLQKIRYVNATQRAEFQKRLRKRIEFLINRKLRSYFKTYFRHRTDINDPTKGFSYYSESWEPYDAVLFKPYIDRCYQRIYWISPQCHSLRKTHSSRLRQWGKRIKYTTVEPKLLRV
ncbi:hypothetical protein Cantr_06678 [Candida viswanathii]|uniref:Uncharacterized protein n=1 Tax=Candida viswanathii TaxID=5486 RepID=A0A367XVF6_9ASCO|nr:hypothetical protein Cantr_06678 [Candida viswanathii]